MPRLLWWPLLHGVILRARAAASARKYAAIWTADGSPLLVHTRALADAVAAAARRTARGRQRCATASRRSPRGLRELRDARRAAPAGAAAVSAVFGHDHGLGVRRGRRRARAVAPRAGAALRRRLPRDAADRRARRTRARALARTAAASACCSPSTASRSATARGRSVSAPVPRERRRTRRAALGLRRGEWDADASSRASAASRGCSRTPTRRCARWPREGMKRVDVVCPGFAVDCLETLEEIAIASIASALPARRRRRARATSPRSTPTPGHVDAARRDSCAGTSQGVAERRRRRA